MLNLKLVKLFLIIFFFNFYFFTNVQAYIGLAPLVPIIGQVIVWIVVGLIAIFGFIAYPLKLLLNKNKKNKPIAKKK